MNNFEKCTTVGELKAAIKDLPDDMPVGKWDGCGDILYPWVNGAPNEVYKDSSGSDSVYNWSDAEPAPSKTMLVI